MKYTWKGYLRSLHSATGRVLLGIGGTTPGNTKRMIQTRIKNGEDGAEDIMAMFKNAYDGYMARSDFAPGDPGDWVACNNGRMRATHVEEAS
jgi:hypothetical protein